MPELTRRERLRLYLATHPVFTSFSFFGVSALLIAFIFWWAGYPLSFPITFYEFNRQYPFILLTMIFGASVGAAEIASRYRDEPFLAIISAPGRTYLAFNATISLAAFCLLARYPRLFGLDSEPRDFLIMSVVAGFGSMVVMRSKLFNFKNDKGDTFAVGPDAVINSLLSSVDRNVDRYRSFDRQSLVFNETAKIKSPEAAPIFIETFLASYQNLSEDEKTAFSKVIEGVLKRQDLPAQLKLMAIGFGFLNISGETNFKALMDLLAKYEEKKATPSGGTP